MSIEIELEINVEDASDRVNSFQDNFTASMKKAAASGEKSLHDFSKSAASDLAKAADASKKMSDAFSLDKALGKLGDLKDLTGKLGTSLFGLSDQTTKTAGTIFDLAQKGASLGSIIPGVGTLAGGLAGAFLGLASSAKDAAKATAELTEKKKLLRQELQTTLGGTADALKGLAIESGVDVYKTEWQSVSQLEERSKKLGETIKQNGQFAYESSKSYEALSNSQKATKQEVDAAKKSAEYYSLNLADLKQEQNAVTKALNEARAAEELFAGSTDVVADKKLPKLDKGLKSATKSASDFAKQFDVLSDSVIGSLGRDGVDAAKRLEEALKGPRRVTEEIEKHMLTISHGITHEEPDGPKPKDDSKDPKDIDYVNDSLVKMLGVSKEAAASIQQIGQTAASSIGGIAASSFDLLFERISTGQKASEGDIKKMISSFLRATGTSLIADGTANLLIGGVKTLSGDPLGPEIAALGGIEVGTGLSMGGIGAIGQRRQGYKGKGGADQRTSGGSSQGGLGRSATASMNQTQLQPPVIININTLAPGDQRSQEMMGIQVAKSLNAAIGVGARIDIHKMSNTGRNY